MGGVCDINASIIYSSTYWLVLVIVFHLESISLCLCVQIGLAVGDTQKVEKRAMLTYLSLQVCA